MGAAVACAGAESAASAASLTRSPGNGTGVESSSDRPALVRGPVPEVAGGAQLLRQTDASLPGRR